MWVWKLLIHDEHVSHDCCVDFQYVNPKGAFTLYIRDLDPSIRVWAWTQLKQVNWCFVFTLIRVCVWDFCLRYPWLSWSLPVAISSDMDVRGWAMHMLKAACSHGRHCKLPKWPWPRMTSDLSLGCSVNTILSGAWTWMLRQCKQW